MAAQILVALSSRDRIEEVIPHIKEIATAGVRVVFLIRFPADPWTWLQDHWVTTESSRGDVRGKENPGAILMGYAKGIGRGARGSMVSRFAEHGSRGKGRSFYGQLCKRGGKL